MSPISAAEFKARMMTQAETLWPGTLTIDGTDYPVAMVGGETSGEFDLNAEVETLSMVCQLSRARLETAPADHLAVELNGQPCRISQVSNRLNPHDSHWRMVLGPLNR